MLRLLPALALLGALAAPAGTSKTCPACSSPQNCAEIVCPSSQDSCLFSQMPLENGTVIEHGSCVAPGECQEGVYSLTYGPGSSLWVSTVCCENNCSSPLGHEARPKAQPNAVKCHYCSGDKSAPCDSLSVMNCTGDQTVCVTLNGTWSTGDPQTLKGCATEDICNLPANATLGPEKSGFHLTSKPECTQPGPHATSDKPKATICFTCSDADHCDPLHCPEERNYCLQTVGIAALGKGDSVAWRNGSCVASKDCNFDNSISALTYSIRFGFWVNNTCCQGSCQEPTPLPATLPVSRALSKFLCPTCFGNYSGPCYASFYKQCPSGQTRCVQLNLVTEEGGRNVSVMGCGSRDLCSDPAATAGFPALPGHRLGRPPDRTPRRRAVLESQCRSDAAPGLHLALPVLVVALVTAALS
ncbi:uncharacterized protein LOC102481749 [Tupaia chinensis]|uniref:uncharacterized protein LOC102481749 n=1 Tax=Tupaia chinensis TaxID=246437 RepID=UPI0003C8DE4B|nr:uncharacterized protein LOC102481749 [Tupaia chinensis]